MQFLVVRFARRSVPIQHHSGGEVIWEKRVWDAYRVLIIRVFPRVSRWRSKPDSEELILI